MSDEFLMNRLGNADNIHQGKYKRVLCLCSAGLLRSPTAAVVLSQDPYNYNTRAAGLTKEFALVPVDEVLLSWADEIVVMQPDQAEKVRDLLDGFEKPIVVLSVPDRFRYRDPELVRLIKESYDKYLKETE